MIYYPRAVQNPHLAVLLRNLMRMNDLVHIPYVYHISLYLLSYKYRTCINNVDIMGVFKIIYIDVCKIIYIDVCKIIYIDVFKINASSFYVML